MKKIITSIILASIISASGYVLAAEKIALNEMIFHYISDSETEFKQITQFNTCRKRYFMRL